MTSAGSARVTLPWDAADPYPFYARKRCEGTVVWDDCAQASLVLSYPAAQQILADPTGWTSNPLANPAAVAALGVLGDEALFARSMLNTDGATHQRLRGSVRDVFTRTFIAGLHPPHCPPASRSTSWPTSRCPFPSPSPRHGSA